MKSFVFIGRKDECLLSFDCFEMKIVLNMIWNTFDLFINLNFIITCSFLVVTITNDENMFEKN